MINPKKRTGRRLNRVQKEHKYYAKRLAILVERGKILSREEIREKFNLSPQDLETVLDYFSRRYPTAYQQWRISVLRRGPETKSKKSESRYADLARKLVNASPEERKEIMERIKYEKLEKLALEQGGIFKEALEVYISSLPPAQRKRLERKLEGYTEEMLLSDIKSLAYLLVPIKGIARILGMKPDTIRRRVNQMREEDPRLDRALKLAEGIGMSVYAGENAAHPRTILELVEILRENRGNAEHRIKNRLSIEPLLYKYADVITQHMLSIDPRDIKLSDRAREGLKRVIKEKEENKLLVFGINRDKVYEIIENGLAEGKTLDQISKEIAERYNVREPSKNAVLYHKGVIVRRILAREGVPHYHELVERAKKGELDETVLPVALGIQVYRNYLAGKLHPIAQKEIDKLIKQVKKKKKNQPK